MLTKKLGNPIRENTSEWFITRLTFLWVNTALLTLEELTKTTALHFSCLACWKCQDAFVVYMYISITLGTVKFKRTVLLQDSIPDFLSLSP